METHKPEGPEHRIEEARLLIHIWNHNYMCASYALFRIIRELLHGIYER